MAAGDPGMADPPPAPLSYSTPVISMSNPDKGFVSHDIPSSAQGALRARNYFKNKRWNYSLGAALNEYWNTEKVYTSQMKEV